jgi:starch phosphorylase
LFHDFHNFFPEKFINITNGITPRRWLNLANKQLSSLITSRIGGEWVTDLSQLERLTEFAGDDEFRREFMTAKHLNKVALSNLFKRHMDVAIDPDSLFDVQIKRIHEYKRQLLNILHVITLYNRLRDGRADGRVPRTILIAGKAAPGYALAKLIIRLICDVSDIVNNDPKVRDQLKVVFIPNYDVTTATDIIPASDLSEQISTAGTEASGTGNMKLALNGALTIGTLDGANVEIREAVGEENIFIFGNSVEQVQQLKAHGYDPFSYLNRDDELKRVLQMIGSGYFSPREPNRYQPIIDALTQGGDRYLLLADYRDYVTCQERVDHLYLDRQEWSRRAILNVAHMGRFSSDRTITEYARNIWDITTSHHDMPSGMGR